MSHHPNEVLQRARIARSVLMLVFVALASAFFRAQIVRSAEFALQSESNRLREVPLPGARAIIYDRNKEIIAENIAGYSISILTPKEDSLRAAMRALARVVNLDSVQQERVVRRFRAAPNRPAVIFNDAPFDIVSVLEEHRVEFPGLIIQSAPKRYYPDGPAVAAFVGYTGEISQQELLKDKFADYKAGQQVGKAGLEQQYETRLRGTEGMRFVEVDARNRVVRESGVRPDVAPEAPAPLYTNIDMDLQRFAHDYFGDSLQGAMVALEPKTGKVLALYSAPTYDVNKFIGGVSSEYYNSLQTDPRKPMYNKATQGQYPPASTWKLATAAIGLQKNVVTMDTHMPQPCTGGYTYGGRYYKCWDHSGHGDITLAQAIAKSCDVYFYQLGLRLGLLDLVAGGVRLGFGTKAGIDLQEEKPGIFPDGPKYFDKKYGPRGWTNSSGMILNMSIGQGDDAQTPLNMAKFYTALATDGKAATPRIVDTTIVRTEVLGLDADKLKGLQNALGDVLTRGTGAGAQIKGLTIAGKTGTAQNAGPDHAWFVGYAPVEQPKIVVAVLLEHGLHGSAAAKIATKMMERYLKAKLTLTSITPDG